MAGVRDLRPPRALADHAQHPAAGVLAQVGDVGGAGLIDAQGVLQQQPHRGRGAQRLGAGVGIGGGDQGPGLVPVQADGGRVVRIHRRPGHALGGHPAGQVMGRAVPVELRPRRFPHGQNPARWREGPQRAYCGPGGEPASTLNFLD